MNQTFDFVRDALCDLPFGEKRQRFTARSINERHLVRISPESGSGIAQRVQDDEVELFATQFLLCMRLFVVGFQGEPYQNPTRFPASQFRCDVFCPLQADDQTAVVLFQLVVGVVFRCIIRHGGTHDRAIGRIECLYDGLIHLFGRENVVPCNAGGGGKGRASGDEKHFGTACRELSGDGVAHLARRMVRDEPHGVDGLDRRPGRNDHPFTGEAVPIWISDYVLAGYGTGAIMAVPAHDSRDYAFAKHFGLEIRPLVKGCDVSEESFDAKEGIVCNSPKAGATPYCDLSLNGLTIKEAIAATKKYVKEHKLGRVKVNYRLRDAIFSRQRYWGEPFPVYYKDNMPYMIPENCLPLELPEVAKFLPTETGEPPLGHATRWAWDTANNCVVENSRIDNQTIFPLELNTMPGFAGSSAYYLRYMDPRNHTALVDKKVDEYWRNVDLYVGGTEHATGHLIYSRFWNKFLHDLGISVVEEPFQKLVNQGMIQGRSNFVYRIKDTNTFVSLGLKDQYDVTPLHVDVNIVSNDILDTEAFKAWRPEYATAEFILEDGKYVCGWAVEKMSKSMFNVVNPDMIVEKYGADTLRMYEMFLGPVEQSKPWDTNGIDGVHRFLKKFWSLFYDRTGNYLVTDDAAGKDELKSLHKLIKKVTGDIETFSYNTSISAFMICVNELSGLKCNKKEILEQLIIVLAPFAPHVCEELWETLGHTTSVCDAQWPAFNEAYLVENTVNYTISFNGKARFNMEFPTDAASDAIQAAVLADERSQKWIEGKTPKKVIVVPKKIVNVVI